MRCAISRRYAGPLAIGMCIYSKGGMKHMTVVAAVPHEVGKPVMLTAADIKRRKKEITDKYGSLESLRRKEAIGFITLDERIALQNLEKLAYLESV